MSEARPAIRNVLSVSFCSMLFRKKSDNENGGWIYASPDHRVFYAVSFNNSEGYY